MMMVRPTLPKIVSLMMVLLLHGLAVLAWSRRTPVAVEPPPLQWIEVRLQPESPEPAPMPPAPRASLASPAQSAAVKPKPRAKVNAEKPPEPKYLLVDAEDAPLPEAPAAPSAEETPAPTSAPAAEDNASPALPSLPSQAPTKITGMVAVAQLCDEVPPPPYPHFARQNNVVGNILVRFKVRADGSLAQVIGINYGGMAEKYRAEFLTAIHQSLHNIRCQTDLDAAILEKSFSFNLQ